MRLRKSTWIWLGVFAAAEAAGWTLQAIAPESGCLVGASHALALSASLVLAWRATAFLFRWIVRRTALRLAFSYFLIGLVPIPLLAMLLFLASYIVAHQYMANRLRREITSVGESALASPAALPRVAVAKDGRVDSSQVPWLPTGSAAPWLRGLTRPAFLEAEGRLWLAVTEGPRSVRLLDLSDPSAPWVQRLADATGYQVELGLGTAASQKGGGFEVTTSDEEASARGLRVGTKKGSPASPSRRPHGAPPPGKGVWNGEWIHAFYLETLANVAESQPRTGHNVAILQATTSPRVLSEQLFSQGVAGMSGIFWVVFVALGAVLLVVYLVALTIAFVLAGSIARNVNRLTRAAQAVSRGDFSVRVRSKSRDQIGDLARSFDGMAESIQRLLLDTARKERLEAEIAMARTIQHKLLPPTEATLPGFSVLVYFEPVAEIGGDYYDFLPMPDGRTAVALGDVSGHGLPTGLLVAMAKAALSTLLEAGHKEGELFARLNDLIHRSTDPRHYMTLCLLSYDAATRRGTLTNAGQLAPYRISAGRIESLSLPSFPLGLFPDKEYPSRGYEFAAGDLLVLFSDGLVEAADGNGEPFGFEQFERVLRDSGGAGAAALRDALLAALTAHTGGVPPDDDRTLVILTLD